MSNTQNEPLNKPQLSVEMERRFDEQISYSLHEIVDGDWCPALGVPHYNPFNDSSTTPLKPNYRVFNLVGNCTCGAKEKIAKIKQFLATALEEKKQKLLSEVEGWLVDEVLEPFEEWIKATKKYGGSAEEHSRLADITNNQNELRAELRAKVQEMKGGK